LCRTIVACLLAAGLLAASPILRADTGEAAEQTLRLIREWVHGRYDNAQQADADLADSSIPDDLKHRLMHQLFVPVAVPVPGVPGYLVFQQSSVDGTDSPPAITRVGLLQFSVDPQTGLVRQRELNFKDPEAFKNAYREPERLGVLGLGDFNVDPGCDFFLRLDPRGTQITGPMQSGKCRFFSRGLNKELIADDAVTIRPDEYWFLGRFVDAEGRVMWGNASAEPVKMRRRAGLPP